MTNIYLAFGAATAIVVFVRIMMLGNIGEPCSEHGKDMPVAQLRALHIIAGIVLSAVVGLLWPLGLVYLALLAWCGAMPAK